MFQVAVQKQKTLANPCDRVDPPRVPRREMTFLDWDDAVRLAEAHNERCRAMIYLAVDSGMRWSELVGLRRGKVDLRNGKVRVTEQLVQLSDGTFVRKEPKTSAGIRSISRFTVSVLADHIDEHSATGPDGLVFANAAGNPLSSSSFLTHHFAKAQRSVGVHCRFHDLRHTSVALAIASGAHPKAIQARMGHSSIDVTLDRNGHLFPELDEPIALAFDTSFQQALERRANVVVAGDFSRRE
jgi:integrase